MSRATEAAIREARKAHLGALDQGAIAALRTLARKIDTEAELRELALKYAEASGQKPPSVDNVSIPTYLKFCESLGLTPLGRSKLGEKKPEGASGKLGQLRAVAQGSGA